MINQGWQFPSQKVPLTWYCVLDLYPGTAMTRFYIRRYVIPMSLLLPRPSAVTEILKLVSEANIKQPPSNVRLQIQYSNTRLQETFRQATKAFFHMYNTFFPLFSEEAFHSKPRLPMLRRIVIHIGLERMPQTDFVKEASILNNFIPKDLLCLPPCLDTLQCLLLAQYGVQDPGVERVRYRIFCFVNRLIPLLGIQADRPNSPQWLERALALHMESLGGYSFSVGQFVRLSKVMWVKVSNTHLKHNFLLKKTNLDHFPHLNDRILFISSQTMYHSYAIVVAANRGHTTALNERHQGTVLSNELKKHIARMKENFMWGWSHLSHLHRVSPSPLLKQSRLMLVLRFQNDSLEIMKLGLHIPLDQTQRVTSKPNVTITSPYSLIGLNKAIHLINMISTLNPAPFVVCPLLIIMLPLSFIMSHCKVAKFEYSCANRLTQTLRQARDVLAKYWDVPFYSLRAQRCLAMVDFFMRRQKISLGLPSK
ncbi:hypothetical protein DSO57_1037673 [Entomophthora muscae]|uniref:Uncharacterized protein n=1 Tax=Entomophthora muscae TaxID=34485 RepID=A0ACC2S0U9_9FUNG|nr:hypothetical protein DSO57_1037673 [Entomophthora muscae]